MSKPNQTAYGKMQEKKRRDAKRKKTRVPARQAVARGKCGGKLRNAEGFCQRPAGWGTNHSGIGKCRNHGGNRVSGKRIQEEAVQFMGAPKTISPIEAIIWCIETTAGEVEWLSNQIAAINSEDDWYEHTVVGKQMNVLVRFRAEAQDRLVKYAKDALALGLAERAVRMAEQFGATIAKLLEGIANDIELTPDQRKKWQISVRKNLILLQGGQVIEQPDDKIAPLVAIPRRTGGHGK